MDLYLSDLIPIRDAMRSMEPHKRAVLEEILGAWEAREKHEEIIDALWASSAWMRDQFAATLELAEDELTLALPPDSETKGWAANDWKSWAKAQVARSADWLERSKSDRLEAEDELRSALALAGRDLSVAKSKKQDKASSKPKKAKAKK